MVLPADEVQAKGLDSLQGRAARDLDWTNKVQGLGGNSFRA